MMRIKIYFFLTISLIYQCQTSLGADAAIAAQPAYFINAQSTPTEITSFYSFIAEEMITQIFARKPKSPQEVASVAGALMQGTREELLQGMQMEHVYNSLVRSEEYRMLERGTASLEALRFFSLEVADIGAGAGASPQELERRAASIAGANLASSLFTLKRIMGERSLEEMHTNKNFEKRAVRAVRYTNLNIPFGRPIITNILVIREWIHNNPHNVWESLNIVHRILNHYGGVSANIP